jgi:glycosyltransferase involved in cell wall biosynthesis
MKHANSRRESIRKELDFEEGDVVIGAIGRLVALKNYDLLLKAAEILSEQNAQVKLLIIGDGPLFNSLNSMAEDLGIKDRVRFTGWRNDIENLMPAIDIYAIASGAPEGLNISVLEAMAFEKPVVGTNISGISEPVINNESGLLVSPSDCEALADGLRRLVRDPESRERMARRGRERIKERYSVDRMVQRTSELYRKLKRSFDASRLK